MVKTAEIYSGKKAVGSKVQVGAKCYKVIKAKKLLKCPKKKAPARVKRKYVRKAK